MRVFLRIIVWFVILLVVVFLVGFLLPKSVHVERSAAVNSSPATVFALVNDLKTYDDWMPWNRIDPEMKKQFGPSTVGQGAWYTWDSNNKNVGHGKLTIVESEPENKVITRLEFEGFDPTEGGWEIRPTPSGSEVKWFMNSNMGNNPVGRWMGLFMNKMVGPQFEEGLANLKRIAEQKKPADSTVTPVNN